MSWFFTGLVPVYLDLERFNFQVPRKVSAPNIPMAVIARPTNSFVTILFIILFSFSV